MKFLVDAQLPRRLAEQLRSAGHDVVHTLDLPLQNHTPDAFINQISLNEERTVITKDADFVNSFILHQEPYKLLLVATGNCKNSDLLKLFADNIDRIVEGFIVYKFIELDRSHVIFHP